MQENGDAEVEPLISVFYRISVIPLGFEPKTYCLEGSCSNPTELRNQTTLLLRAVQRYEKFN